MQNNSTLFSAWNFRVEIKEWEWELLFCILVLYIPLRTYGLLGVDWGIQTFANL